MAAWEELVVFPFRVVGLDNLDFNIKCHSRSFWERTWRIGGSTRNFGEVSEKYWPPKWISRYFNNHDQNCVLSLVPSFGASSLFGQLRYKLQIKAMGVEKSTKYTISWGDIELVPKNKQFRGFQFAFVFDAFSMDISHISWWFVGG